MIIKELDLIADLEAEYKDLCAMERTENERYYFLRGVLAVLRTAWNARLTTVEKVREWEKIMDDLCDKMCLIGKDHHEA